MVSAPQEPPHSGQFGNSPWTGYEYHLIVGDDNLTVSTISSSRRPRSRKTGIHPLTAAEWWRYRLPGFGSINWPAFFTVLMDTGYKGAMNIEHEDPLYGFPFQGDEFPEAYKTGFRVAQRYLRHFLPV
jgi:hypothetical protein